MSKWNLPPRGEFDRASGIYYQNMTQKEIHERRKKNDVIIIPVGSTETHGPGEPLGEDTFLCTRMAEEVARVTGCTVAHPICYSTHPYHHVGMPGTIIIPDQVMIDYLMCVMVGFWNAGYRKMIIMERPRPGMGAADRDPQFRQEIPGAGHLHHAPLVVCGPGSGDGQGPRRPVRFPAGSRLRSRVLVHQGRRARHGQGRGPGRRDGAPEVCPRQGSLQRSLRAVAQTQSAGGNTPAALGSEIVWYPEGNLGPSTQMDAKKAVQGIENVLDYMEKLVNDINESVPPGTLPPYTDFTHRDNPGVSGLLEEPGRAGLEKPLHAGLPDAVRCL